jgi:hypothetical protein
VANAPRTSDYGLVALRAGYIDVECTREDDFVVFIATKPPYGDERQRPA